MSGIKSRVNSDEITFGIEIECFVPVRWAEQIGLQRGIYHSGRMLPSIFPYGWNCQQDGSLSINDYTMMAVEIVSPVLRGIEGLRQVEKVAEILTAAGAKVNSTCGVHVHVGAQSILGVFISSSNKVAEWVRRLLNLTSGQETALFAIGGNPERMNSRYCRSIKSAWVNKLKSGDSYQKAREENGRIGRFMTLNLNNLFNEGSSKRTVEFRVFNSTLNAQKLVGYVMVAMGLAAKAAIISKPAGFDTQSKALVDVLKDLHGSLYWTPRGKFEKDKQAEFGRLGVPTGAWEEFGRKVLKNQRWNVARFTERAANVPGL